MPRWIPAVLALSVLVLLTVAARPILFPAGNPRLTRENFDRIEEGMRREEVEAILGPPGDYRTGPTHQVDLSRPHLGPSDVLPGEALEWEGAEADILVWLNRPGGIVFGRNYEPMTPVRVGFFDLLRWRWNHWWESMR